MNVNATPINVAAMTIPEEFQSSFAAQQASPLRAEGDLLQRIIANSAQ